MNLRNLVCLAGSTAFAVLAFGQQPTLTVSNDHPKPGEAVVIEVNVSPDRTTKISWTKQGDGEFATETQNQKSVKFIPSTPGSTVVIVCDVSTPARQDHPSTTLVVAGAQAPARPQQGFAARPGAAAHHAGDLALADMEYMIPSGWMGDATAENNGAAILGTGFNQGCWQNSPSCTRSSTNPRMERLDGPPLLGNGSSRVATTGARAPAPTSADAASAPCAFAPEGFKMRLGCFPRFSSSRGALSLQSTQRTGHRMRWLDRRCS